MEASHVHSQEHQHHAHGTHASDAHAQQQHALQALKQQQQQYRDYLVSSICISAGVPAPTDGEGRQAAHAELNFTHTSPEDIPRLAESVFLASSARTFLAALKAWAEAVRELERRCRDFTSCSCEPPADPSPPQPYAEVLEAFSKAAYHAVEGLGTCVYAASVADYYGPPVEQAVPDLHAASLTIRSRMMECRHSLYTKLTEDLARALEAVSWPPPLAPTTSNSRSSDPHPEGDSSGAPHHKSADEERRASNGGTSTTTGTQAHLHTRPREFTGFNADPTRLAQLHTLIACLSCLQQAAQPQEFQQLRAALEQASAGHADGVQHLEEGPVLRAASAGLVPPLQARLQAHFAPSRAAGRLDKPEWLFQTVLKLVQEHVGHVATLQPALEAAGLGGRCHMAVEYARAMRDAIKAVLRTARLPALQSAWEQDDTDVSGELWRIQVQEAIEFELKLAPFLGASQAALASSAALPEPLLAASVLRAITDDPESLACWLAAEREGAMARLKPVMEDGRAWMPPSSDEDEDQGLMGRAQHSESGWQREFNPPHVAEELMELFKELVDKSRSMPTADAQKALLDGVGAPVLETTVERMTDTLEQAASAGGILSETWVLRVGACVAAARYLHHVLSELLEGPALSRLHAAARAQAASTPASGPAESSTDGKDNAQQQDTASQNGLSKPPSSSNLPGGMGDVVMQHSFAPVPLNPPVLAAGVASLGSLHREWGLRIAQELARSFSRAAVGYKEAVESADSYPTHSGAAGTVTPILEPAMALLQAGLHALAPALDGPSFRDIWRAVTVPVNRFLFNYVATEAYFSQAGAHQFAVDCTGMVAVFAPFTKRPAAHFRETLAAARLLTLGDQEAAEVVRRASAQSVAGEPLWREPWLVQLGVGCLSAQQAVAVVERRL